MIIFDSHFICHAAKHTLDLQNAGHHTGVIYGFMKRILYFAKYFNDNHLVFCWDSKQSRRKKIYPAYKEHRHSDKTPEEIEMDMTAHVQFEEVRTNVLPALGFKNNFRAIGYEADDLIAKLVFDPDGLTPVVITADEDMFQLLDYCSVYNPNKKVTMSKKKFIDEYGIKPAQWVDVKAIAGCNSDNVKGIVGIGTKTAIKYLLGDLKRTTQAYQKIKDVDQDMLNLNYKLVTLPFKGTPHVETEPNNCTMKKFLEVCDNYGFQSLRKQKREWKEFVVNG